jgi:hypothetical protein
LHSVPSASPRNSELLDCNSAYAELILLTLIRIQSADRRETPGVVSGAGDVTAFGICCKSVAPISAIGIPGRCTPLGYSVSKKLASAECFIYTS